MNLVYYDAYQCRMADKRRWFLDDLAAIYPDVAACGGPKEDGKDAFGIMRQLDAADGALIWGGREPGCLWFADECRRRGIPYGFVERGLLPQGENAFFDPAGMGCYSSLGRGGEACIPVIPSGARVSIVCQLAHDANFAPYVPYRTTATYVQAALARASCWDAASVTVCPHPIDPVPYGVDPQMLSGRPTVETPADIAIGVCSGALYALAERGVEIVSMAEHPDGHPLYRDTPENVLAQIRSQQHEAGGSVNRLAEILDRCITRKAKAHENPVAFSSGAA